MRRYPGTHEFELRVEPRGNNAYGLAVLEIANSRGPDTERPVARIWGDPLRLTIERVLAALKKAHHRPTELRRARSAPFRLREEDGVRLGLLFLAIKPLKKIGRIEAIAERISAMEPEELWYWYSKGSSAVDGRRALRALRILMAQE